MKRDHAADEATVLRVLRLADVGEWTPAAHLAARLGKSTSYASNVVARLRAKGHRIDCNRFGGGGYRLLAPGEAVAETG